MTEQTFPAEPEKTNSTDRAYKQILHAIVTNQFKPGQILSEPELSERYHLSRTPVREALNKLEGEGFVLRNGAKRMVYQLTADDIDQLFDLKIAIEGMIAYKAATSDDECMRAQMLAILAEMEAYEVKQKASTGEIEQWHDIDNRFHDLLYNMAHNYRARAIIDNLNAQWHRFRMGLSSIAGHLTRSISEHIRIGYAVIDHEPATAREAMEEHFRNLQAQIKTLMNIFGNN